MSKSHALVVGGTGMLRPVALQFAREGWVVSVVARSAEQLQELVEEASAFGGRINPVAVDYEKHATYDAALSEATRTFGEIELAIVWIHRTAPEAYFITAKHVNGRFIHVLGSSTADPSNAEGQATRRKRFKELKNIGYQEVILGFVIEKGISRWLKKEEIANGVLHAVQHATPQHIVGTITPWSAKP